MVRRSLSGEPQLLLVATVLTPDGDRARGALRRGLRVAKLAQVSATERCRRDRRGARGPEALPEGRLDVPRAVSRRVTVEVGRPLRRTLAPAEPLLWGPRQRSQHVVVDATMPLENFARRSTAPSPVNEAVDLVHVEATHLRRPSLAADHAGRVLLPVDDVGEGVLHRPRIPRRGTGNPPAPVNRTQPGHETVEPGKLAPRPVDNFLSSVSHVRGTSVLIPSASRTGGTSWGSSRQISGACAKHLSSMTLSGRRNQRASSTPTGRPCRDSLSATVPSARRAPRLSGPRRVSGRPRDGRSRLPRQGAKTWDRRPLPAGVAVDWRRPPSQSRPSSGPTRPTPAS